MTHGLLGTGMHGKTLGISGHLHGVLVLTRNAPPPIRIPALHLRGMCVKVPSWIGQFHLHFTAAVPKFAGHSC